MLYLCMPLKPAGILPIFLIVLLAFLSTPTTAQQHNSDSLEKKLKENIHDTLRAKAMNNLAHAYLRAGRLNEALELCNKTLELSTRINYLKGIGAAYNTLGNAYGQIADYPRALENLQKGLETRIKVNDKIAIAGSYNNIGIIYYSLSDFPKAIDYMQKALKIQEEMGNRYFVAAAIGNIAVLYEKLGEDSLSYVYQMKSYQIHKDMDNKQDMVASLNNLASLFRKKKDFKKALDYNRQSRELLDSIKDLRGMVENYSTYGLVYYDMGHFAEAIKEFETALRASVQLGDKKMEAEQLNLMGRSLFGAKQTEKAMEYYNKAYAVASGIGSLDDQRIAAEGLYTIYRSKNDLANALMYHEKLTQLKDSIFNTSKNTAFNNLKTQFALDRQEHELKLKSEEELRKKENERKQQRFINYIIAAILLLVLIFSYFLYQRFKITNSQKKIIEYQKVLVEQKNKAMTDSIYYAERIQKAHLPSEKYISKKINEMKKGGA
jgi:tetratricopeptide (TPR) repeat protein